MNKIATARRGIPTFNALLFDHMHKTRRAWFDKMDEIRLLESDYGRKLLSARTPVEAANICGEWISKRIEINAHEQQRFVTAWLRLFADVMASPSIQEQVSGSGVNRPGESVRASG